MRIDKLVAFPEAKFADVISRQKQKQNRRLLKSIVENMSSEDASIGLMKKRSVKMEPRDPRAFRDLAAKWEDHELGERLLAHFLNRNCRQFNWLQRSLAAFLMSFAFELDLQDLNAYFKEVEAVPLSDCFEKDLADLPGEGISSLLENLPAASANEECPDFAELRKSNAQVNAFAERMETIMLKILILGYKRLCKRIPLDDLCAFLNKSQLEFCSHFWSGSLITAVLFHYASFDLKCKLTALLANKAVVPLVLGHPRTCLEPAALNPFVPLIMLSPQLGIVSFAVGSATRCRIGKSELLNSVLYTQFETCVNDPFSQIRVDADLARNFCPARAVAVVDCNLGGFSFFKRIARLANIVLLTVCFGDFVDGFEAVEKSVRDIINHCKKKRIEVIVVVRDWKEFNVRSSEIESVQKSVWGTRDNSDDSEDDEDSEEDENDDGDDGEDERAEWTPKKLLSDVQKYKSEFEKEESAEKPLRSAKRRLVEHAVSRISESKVLNGDALVKIIKLKNLQYEDKVARTHLLGDFILSLNQIINKASSTEFKFTEDRMSAFIEKQNNKDQNNLNEQIDENIRNVKSELDKLIDSVNNFESQQQGFPFNRLWERKHRCYLKLSRKGILQPSEQIDLESEITRIEKTIQDTEISPFLRSVFRTISKSKFPFTLVFLFEQFLTDLRNREKKRVAESEASQPRAPTTLAQHDMRVYWRNLVPFLSPLRKAFSEKRLNSILLTIETLFAKGYGFELVDGDHYTYQASLFSWFGHILRPADRLMTMAVLGPQSSGKSTLMNLQYATEFATGVGKCTAGICGYLMRVQDDWDEFKQRVSGRKEETQDEDPGCQLSRGAETSPGSDARRFMLFLDSQGMLSTEVDNAELDRKIGTFLMAISQVIVINFGGDFSAKLKNLLDECHLSHCRLQRPIPGSLPKPGQDDARQARSNRPGTRRVHQANKPKSLFFVSNMNFNLDSDSKKSDTKSQIVGSVAEMAELACKLGQPRDRVLFEPKVARVEILENAIGSIFIERDSELAILHDIKRLHRLPRFVRDLRGLSVRAARKLEGLSQAGAYERYTFGRISESLEPIWNRVYFHSRGEDLTSVGKQVVARAYLQQVDAQIQQHVAECGRATSLLLRRMQLLVESGRTTQIKRDELEKQSTELGNRSESCLFGEIFGSNEPATVAFVKQIRSQGFESRSGPLDEQILDAVEADMQRIRRVNAESLEKTKERLVDWIEQKKSNLHEVIRKGFNWDKTDLMTVFERRKQSLFAYDAVLRFNLFWFACKSIFEQIWFSARNEKAASAFSDSKQFWQKIFEKNDEGNQNDNLDSMIESFTEIIENEKCSDQVTTCLQKIFAGLFESMKYESSKKLWREGQLAGKAAKCLRKAGPEYFEVQTGELRNVDSLFARRCEGHRILTFGPEQVQSVYYRRLEDKREIVENIWKSVQNDAPRSGSGFLPRISQTMAKISKLGLVECPKKALSTALSGIFEDVQTEDQEKKVKEYLLALEWNRSKLQNLDQEQLFSSDTFMKIFLIKTDGQKGDFSQRQWTRDMLRKFRSYQEQHYSNLSNVCLDFNLFFAPRKSESLMKLQLVFKIVLNCLGTHQKLSRHIFGFVQDFFENRIYRNGPEDLFEMDPGILKALPADLVGSLVDAVDEEMACHAASVGKNLRDAMTMVVYQKWSGLYAQKMRNWLQQRSHQVQSNWGEYFTKLKRQFAAAIREKISNSYSKFWAENRGDLTKKNLITRIDIRNFELLSDDKPKKYYNQIIDYFRNPGEYLKEEFQIVFTKKFSEFIEHTKLKESLSDDLENSIEFLNMLSEQIDSSNLLDENGSFEREEKCPNSEIGISNFKRLQKILNSRTSETQNHFGDGKFILKTDDLLKKFDLPKTPKALIQIFSKKVRVYDVRGFISGLIHFVIHFKNHFFKSESGCSVFDSFEKEEKEKLENELTRECIGCTERCPCCNRICEGEAGHEGQHHLKFSGHGIINLFNKNDDKNIKIDIQGCLEKYKKKAGKFLENLLNCILGECLKNRLEISDYNKMKLEFGHEQSVRNAVIKNRLVNFKFEMNQHNDWSFKVSPKNPSNFQQHVFSSFVSCFWKKLKEHHCKLNLYKFEKTPINFTFINFKEMIFEKYNISDLIIEGKRRLSNALFKKKSNLLNGESVGEIKKKIREKKKRLSKNKKSEKLYELVESDNEYSTQSRSNSNTPHLLKEILSCLIKFPKHRNCIVFFVDHFEDLDSLIEVGIKDKHESCSYDDVFLKSVDFSSKIFIKNLNKNDLPEKVKSFKLNYESFNESNKFDKLFRFLKEQQALSE